MLSNILRKFQSTFHPVVPFNAGEDKLLKMDFTLANKDLTSTLLNDTNKFAAYMEHLLQKANAKYGIGGYNENRTVYTRSKTLTEKMVNQEGCILVLTFGDLQEHLFSRRWVA